MPGLNNEFLSRDAVDALGFSRLGEDVSIHSTAVIVDCAKLSLGSRIRIDPYVIVSTQGMVEIGDNVHIGAHSAFAGRGDIHIGDFVNISHGVRIFTSRDDPSGRAMTNPTVPEQFKGVRTRSITLGRHAAIGAGTVLLPGARLPEGTVVGALSLAGRPLKPWTIYAGVPVRRLRDRQRDALGREQEYLNLLENSG